jgi:hypothetical protein
MSNHVVAIATCTTADQNGVRVRLTEGVVWDAKDPFVIYRPDLFRHLDEPRSSRTVEQATAAPGEQRKTSRPRKTTES